MNEVFKYMNSKYAVLFNFVSKIIVLFVRGILLWLCYNYGLRILVLNLPYLALWPSLLSYGFIQLVLIYIADAFKQINSK